MKNGIGLKLKNAVRGKTKYIVGGVIICICAAVVIPFVMKIVMPVQDVTAETILKVEEESPQVREIQNTARVVGDVKSDDSRNIISKVSGEILQMNVSEGDYVNEGDVICVIDSDNLTSSSLSVDTAQSSVSSARLQVENSRLSLESAQKNLENAKRDLERNEALYNAGSISLSTLETYQDAVTTAQNSVTSSQNALTQAEYSLDQAMYSYETATDSYDTLHDSLYVKASIGGVVEHLDVKAHDNVTAQTQICTISKKTKMTLVCNVSSAVASSLTVGDEASVSQKGAQYTGVIESVGSDADSATGLYEVKIGLSDASELASNSKATAYLNTESSADSLTVPYNAVYYSAGKPYVYVDNAGTAELRYISTGIYNDDYIVVTEGLAESDSVITSWSSNLSDGLSVEKAVD